MKDIKARSKCQMWQSKRCWSNKGKLGLAYHLISQVKMCKSTLTDEVDEINKAMDALSYISKTWDSKLYREASQKLYNKRST